MTLEIENLVGGYSRVPVLKDISFTVKAGELVGLIGLNGQVNLRPSSTLLDCYAHKRER